MAERFSPEWLAFQDLADEALDYLEPTATPEEAALEEKRVERRRKTARLKAREEFLADTGTTLATHGVEIHPQTLEDQRDSIATIVTPPVEKVGDGYTLQTWIERRLKPFSETNNYSWQDTETSIIGRLKGTQERTVLYYLQQQTSRRHRPDGVNETIYTYQYGMGGRTPAKHDEIVRAPKVARYIFANLSLQAAAKLP